MQEKQKEVLIKNNKCMEWKIDNHIKIKKMNKIKMNKKFDVVQLKIK
jgi:hypothetical protein